MPTYPNLDNFWSRAKATVALAALALLVLGFASPHSVAQGGAVPIPNPITTYASWGDQTDRNQGMLFIYPLEDGTDLNLYEATSAGDLIQINTLVLSVSGAAKDVPIAFGPLTQPQHFFKLQSNKRVNWELVTPDYSTFREASRFVASERQNFLGRKFVFHADDDIPGFVAGSPGTEEIVIINPGATESKVSIEKFNTETQVYDAIPKATNITIAAGDFAEFTVHASPAGFGKTEAQRLGTGSGHYRVTVMSGSPVLVWEGRWLTNNTTLGVAPDGSTIGSTIFASVPNDEFHLGTAIDTQVILRIVGITAASYTVSSSPGPGVAFTPVTTGSVAAGAIASVTGLAEDRLYKVTTSGPAEKIQVHYLPAGAPRHGAVMIGGNDGGVTTNPGKSFSFFFEGFEQRAIDVFMPQADTTVTITGPVSGGATSTAADQVFHFLPEFDAAPGSSAGLYTVTASKPVWLVLTGGAGDQQGYFVYTGNAEVSSRLGPIVMRYCHSAGYSGDAACTRVVNGQTQSTTGDVASQTTLETACAAGQPTKGTANVGVAPGDFVTVSWTDINCGGPAGTGSASVQVNSVFTASVGTDVELKAEHSGDNLVRLRVVPRETEYDFIDNLTKGVKRIVVESLNDGKLLEKWAINGGERLVVQVKNTPDVFSSAAVRFWLGHTRFFGPKTIVAKAFLNGIQVGQETRVLSALGRTTFSDLQVYTPGNFGNKSFDKIEFSATPGSWFGLGSGAFNTVRPLDP